MREKKKQKKKYVFRIANISICGERKIVHCNDVLGIEKC